MKLRQNDQADTVNIEHLVPGLSLYSNVGERIAEYIFDVVSFISDCLARFRR